MLTDAREMLRKAKEGHYAVPAFTIYNLEWAKNLLQAAQDLNSPVILSVSEASGAYMGGFAAAVFMVNGLIKSLQISIPAVLHLDHGGAKAAAECINSGFTSVMFDGSKLPLEENLKQTAELAEKAHTRNMSIEAEVGAIAGVEDGNITEKGEVADPEICARMAATGIDFLAAGIGNIHGAYPPGWQGLDFEALEKIAGATQGIPLVLHGGTGIPDAQILKAIAMGVAKINVNTELQIAWANGLKEYFAKGLEQRPRGHDPRKLMEQANKNLYDTAAAKMELFGCAGKA